MPLESVRKVVTPKCDCVIAKQTVGTSVEIGESECSLHPCNHSAEPRNRYTLGDDVKRFVEISARQPSQRDDDVGGARVAGQLRQLCVEEMQHGHSGLLGI